MRYVTKIDTPIGRLGLVDEGGGLTRIAFPDEAAPLRVTAGSTDALRQAAAALDAYFGGRAHGFELPLAPSGTPFQHAVWKAVAAVPHGETATYAEIARRIGRPRAVRAVGAANGANPLPIVIPCHRIIGSDGSLTGYAGGLPIKRWLLAHERQSAVIRVGELCAVSVPSPS